MDLVREIAPFLQILLFLLLIKISNLLGYNRGVRDACIKKLHFSWGGKIEEGEPEPMSPELIKILAELEEREKDDSMP